jgi:hypothetical protein
MGRALFILTPVTTPHDHTDSKSREHLSTNALFFVLVRRFFAQLAGPSLPARMDGMLS